MLVSGLLTPLGPSARIIDLAQRGEIQLLYDDRILHEYRQVLRRPRFGFSAASIGLFLEFLETEGEHLVARPLRPMSGDPSDQPFLEVALSGQADFLVTGNLRDYPKKQLGPLRVLSPREAVVRLVSSGE